jgi:hypothetical protein
MIVVKFHFPYPPGVLPRRRYMQRFKVLSMRPLPRQAVIEIYSNTCVDKTTPPLTAPAAWPLCAST